MRGVVDGHEEPFFIGYFLAAYIFKGSRILNKAAIGQFAKGDNDLWIDQLDLFEQIGLAAGELGVEEFVVVRGTAF
jgi:hypothetical protein